LKKKGYLARLPKTGDKRVVNIALTSAGEKLLGSIPALLHEQLSQRLAKLQDDELTKVEESLETLIRLLEIEEVEASPMITIDGGLEDSLEEELPQ
jgi:DNA-binding MarR family transcriptional regulator